MDVKQHVRCGCCCRFITIVTHTLPGRVKNDVVSRLNSQYGLLLGHMLGKPAHMTYSFSWLLVTSLSPPLSDVFLYTSLFQQCFYSFFVATCYAAICHWSVGPRFFCSNTFCRLTSDAVSQQFGMQSEEDHSNDCFYYDANLNG